MERASLQFSLAALLLTIAVTGGVLALMFQVSTEAACISLIIVVVTFTAIALTGAVHGRANVQTFCLGAIVPLAGLLLFLSMNLAGVANWLLSGSQQQVSGAIEMWTYPIIENPAVPRLLGFGTLASIGLGYVCVAFRWLFERR